MSCRIVLAEDQHLIRESLKFLLEDDDDIHVEAVASDGGEAVASCRALKPDIALLDIRMPRMSGLEAARVIRAERLARKIVFLTTFADEDAIREGLAIGADGIIIKDIEPELFKLALKSVSAGLLVFHPMVAPILGSSPPEEPAASGEAFGLTERDLEVVRFIVRGMGNKEIAHEQGCSEGTVKNRVSAILGKMGLEARTQIAVFAIRNRLITDLD